MASRNNTIQLDFAVLSESHNCSQFDCGNEALNQFLVKRAKTEAEQRLSKTKIAITPDKTIVGFYTMAPATISKNLLENAEGRGVPYSEVPAIRIGRLAVDKRCHKAGIGKALLKHALEACLLLSNQLGGRVVIVDAKDERAASFYTQYGFKKIKANPLTLIIKISTIEKALYDGF